MTPVVLLLALIVVSNGAPTTELETTNSTSSDNVSNSTTTSRAEETQKPPIILAENQYLIEVEDFAKTHRGWEKDPGRVPQRSGASNYKSLHLYKSEKISVSFCLPIEQNVLIRNIFFSNDGWVDILKVQLDGESIGKFRSADSSDWGHLWNEYNYTGPIGEEINLPSGMHTITIIVEDGDEWGVELDAIKLEFSRSDVTVDLKCPEVADGNKTDGNKTDDLNYTGTPKTSTVSPECSSSSPDCKSEPDTDNKVAEISEKTDPLKQTPFPDSSKPTESTKLDRTTADCKADPSKCGDINHTESTNPDNSTSTESTIPHNGKPTDSTKLDNILSRDLPNSNSSKLTDSTKPDNILSRDLPNSNSSKPTDSTRPDNILSRDLTNPDSSKPTDSTNSNNSNPTDSSNPDNSKPIDSTTDSTNIEHRKTTEDTSKPTNSRNSDVSKTTESTPECKQGDGCITDLSSPDNSKPTDSTPECKQGEDCSPDSSKPTDTTVECKTEESTNPDNSDSTKSTTTSGDKEYQSNSSTSTPTESSISDNGSPTESSKPTGSTPECKQGEDCISSPDSSKHIDTTMECTTEGCKTDVDNSKATERTNLDNSKPTESTNLANSTPTESTNLDNSKPTDSTPECKSGENCKTDPDKNKSTIPTSDCKPGDDCPTDTSSPGSSNPTESTPECKTEDNCETDIFDPDRSKPTQSTNTDNSPIASTKPDDNEATDSSQCTSADCMTNKSIPDDNTTTKSTAECTEESCTATSDNSKSTETNNPTKSTPDCITEACEIDPDSTLIQNCNGLDCQQTPTSSDNTKATDPPNTRNKAKGKEEEIYKLNCPNETFLTIVRNDYLGCSDDGKIRFDLYGATVSEVSFIVPHPFVPPPPPTVRLFKRSAKSSVLWEDGYPQEECSVDQIDLEKKNIDISQTAAGGSLPVMIYPQILQSLNLAFTLSSSGLDINKSLRPVFTIGACCSESTHISLTAIESDTDTSIQLGSHEFLINETVKSWNFPYLTSWDDRNIEVIIDFKNVAKPILLNYMKFEIQEVDINIQDFPKPPRTKLLCETKEVKVEGVQDDDPNTKKLKFRINGSDETSEVSSLVLTPAGLGNNNQKPALVFDQSGTCTFNPPVTVPVQDSTSFILGSTDPTKANPKLVIEEVELEEPGVNTDNASIILHLLGASFGRTTMRLKITETETILTLLQVIPIGKPLSSFYLPCDGYETSITADGGKRESIGDSWKTITGEQLTIRRRQRG